MGDKFLMKKVIVFFVFLLVLAVNAERKFPITEQDWFAEYVHCKSEYSTNLPRNIRMLLEVINMSLDGVVSDMGIDESGITYPSLQPQFHTAAWNSWARNNIDVENAGERVYIRIKNIHRILNEGGAIKKRTSNTVSETEDEIEWHSGWKDDNF